MTPLHPSAHRPRGLFSFDRLPEQRYLRPIYLSRGSVHAPHETGAGLSIGFLSSFSFRTCRISARRRPQTATVVITTARLVAGTALMCTATKQKEPWFEIRRNGY